MRKLHYYLLGALAMFLITSLTTETNASKRKFEKIVFLEINSSEDSVIFKPLSKAWKEYWNISSDISVIGSDLMNYERYKSSFKNRNDNLWTIVHPLLIDGELQAYCPYDPVTFGLGTRDDGELRYPITNIEANETFLTSEEVRENLSFMLGNLGPEADFPLVNEFGDPIIEELPDGTQMYVYPPRDFYWHTDEDIVKYKIRISVEFNKKGKEKKRIIKSICPIVNRIGETGKVIGEDELVWLDFQELKPTLKKAYYFDENMKPVSYLGFFEQKAKTASVK